MNLILVKASFPNDPLNGSDMRLWNLIQPRNHQVALVVARVQEVQGQALEWGGTTREAAAMAEIPLGRWDFSPGKHLRKHAAAAQRVLAAVNEIRRQFDGPSATLVCGHMAALALCADEKPFVFDLCDSMALYFQRRAEDVGVSHPFKAANARWMSKIYRNMELFISRHAKEITVASQVDAEFLRQRGASCKVTAVLNGTDWVDAAGADAAAEGHVIGFHGNMHWEPNRVAAIYLASEVMPRVHALVPDAALLIAGGPAFPELQKFHGQNGVQVLGRVDDIKQVLRGCQVYAMPMFQGAGFKNKLAEAMALGLPVVTNQMGVEALDEGEVLVACAETAEGLAHSVADMLKDSGRRGKLGGLSREYARTHFGWEARRQEFRTILEAAAGGETTTADG